MNLLTKKNKQNSIEYIIPCESIESSPFYHIIISDYYEKNMADVSMSMKCEKYSIWDRIKFLFSGEIKAQSIVLEKPAIEELLKVLNYINKQKEKLE